LVGVSGAAGFGVVTTVDVVGLTGAVVGLVGTGVWFDPGVAFDAVGGGLMQEPMM
jgi:hypothetical protein